MKKLSILVSTWIVAGAVQAQDAPARAGMSGPEVRVAAIVGTGSALEQEQAVSPTEGQPDVSAPNLCEGDAAVTPECIGSTITGEELMGWLCVNEGGWSLTDCAVLTHLRMRYARRHHITLKEALLNVHGTRALRLDRALHPITTGRWPDNRPWIGDLRADGHEPFRWRDNPRNGEWERRGLPHWNEILATVRGVIAGSVADPCATGGLRPTIWGGPEVDGAHITRRLEQGWVIVRCMPVTLNTYMAKRRH